MDQIELDVERTLVDHFLQEVMKSNPKATYGELMIRSALEQGAVSTLLLSESLNHRRVSFYCKDCKEAWERTKLKNVENGKCPSCDSNQVYEDEEKSMDLIDNLSLLAGHTSAQVRLISLDTEEGATLSSAFGGIAALLRYPIS